MKGIVNEHESPTKIIAGVAAEYVSDAAEISRRKPGANVGNLNAIKILEHAHTSKTALMVNPSSRTSRGRLLALFPTTPSEHQATRSFSRSACGFRILDENGKWVCDYLEQAPEIVIISP